MLGPGSHGHHAGVDFERFHMFFGVASIISMMTGFSPILPGVTLKLTWVDVTRCWVVVPRSSQFRQVNAGINFSKASITVHSAPSGVTSADSRR